MRFLHWIDRYFSMIERWFLGGAILFASLLLLVNVIMRYIFNDAIYWAEELVRYLMVWIIFVGGSQVAKHEGHIRVDIIHRAVSPRAKVILDDLVNLIAIIFCLILAYYSYRQMMRALYSQQVSPALELHMWIVYLSIPIGSILMAIRYIAHFFIRVYETQVAID